MPRLKQRVRRCWGRWFPTLEKHLAIPMKIQFTSVRRQLICAIKFTTEWKSGQVGKKKERSKIVLTPCM